MYPSPVLNEIVGSFALTVMIEEQGPCKTRIRLCTTLKELITSPLILMWGKTNSK